MSGARDTFENGLKIGIRTAQDGRHPLLLTERREHATMLADLLRRQGITCEVLRGAMRAKDRVVIYDYLDASLPTLVQGNLRFAGLE